MGDWMTIHIKHLLNQEILHVECVYTHDWHSCRYTHRLEVASDESILFVFVLMNRNDASNESWWEIGSMESEGIQ